MEKLQNETRTFFFLACHFSNPLKFVLGLPKYKFSTGKKHFTPGRKIRKTDFAPSEKSSCYTPALDARKEKGGAGLCPGGGLSGKVGKGMYNPDRVGAFLALGLPMASFFI